jgi:hypothetical protein
MVAGTVIVAISLLLALACAAPAKPQSAPVPRPNRQATIEAKHPSFVVEARVKFPVLGSGDQVLYTTVTLDGEPVKGAVVGVIVTYQSVSRKLPSAVTGADGKAVFDWSVSGVSGGFTSIDVTAAHQDVTARTTTGFYPR